MNISEAGVNSVSFYGLYEFDSIENVDIMPLDDVLSLVEDGIETKYINSLPETISSITMAYMMDSEEDLTFYPVWCFCGSYGEESGEMPFLCINAVTGEIEFMAG